MMEFLTSIDTRYFSWHDGNILLEPAIGFDPSTADDYLEQTMTFLQKHNAKCLIYDLKDLSIIDGLYYKWLEKLYNLCCIGGQVMVVVNMQPTAAFGLATFLKDVPPFSCALDVNHAKSLTFEITKEE